MNARGHQGVILHVSGPGGRLIGSITIRVVRDVMMTWGTKNDLIIVGRCLPRSEVAATSLNPIIMTNDADPLLLTVTHGILMAHGRTLMDLTYFLIYYHSLLFEQLLLSYDQLLLLLHLERRGNFMDFSRNMDSADNGSSYYGGNSGHERDGATSLPALRRGNHGKRVVEKRQEETLYTECDEVTYHFSVDEHL